MFIGLDKVNHTIRELYQEILIKVGSHVGKLTIKQVMVLDNLSILCKTL